MRKVVLIVGTLALLAGILSLCTPEKPAQEEHKTVDLPPEVKLAPMINYSVVNKFPHDVNCFTEGFLFHNNQLLESSGAPEQFPLCKSNFGVLDLKTGKLEQKGELDRKIYFGEGILVLNNLLYQLTYTNQIGFIYDAKTYERKGQFNYANREGWGMTTDGKHMIMSDGTNELTYLNPSDFTVLKKLGVKENGFALDHINELEYIKGYIYANVWLTNYIVKIDPNDGNVIGKLDLTALQSDAREGNVTIAEMNGIAYDSINDKILVTGKLWPKVYEISFPH
ncbi:MAG: glutaminyl-peptide cyclotransferase [Bacteroidia bacterium]|nr:glutaminyl-peptide cyclotransferase [Bacteroidia bacterium]